MTLNSLKNRAETKNELLAELSDVLSMLDDGEATLQESETTAAQTTTAETSDAVVQQQTAAATVATIAANAPLPLLTKAVEEEVQYPLQDSDYPLDKEELEALIDLILERQLPKVQKALKEWVLQELVRVLPDNKAR